MAEDWLGLAKGGKVDFAKRIAALDRQIEEQDAAIAAMVVVAAKQGNPENAIEKATRTLNEERAQLVKTRGEVIAWKGETEEADRRAQDVKALVRLAKE